MTNQIEQCDRNLPFKVDELPVWRPYVHRHEHKYEEVTPTRFICADCGHYLVIDSPLEGEE